MRLVARDKDAVALSPVDFFSVGHVIMGQVSYLVFDLIVVLVIGTNALVVKGWCLFATIVEGVLWEPFENIILWRLGWKFENRRDSLVNSLFDVGFVALGGILAAGIPWSVTIGLVVVEFVAFARMKRRVLGRSRTPNRSVPAGTPLDKLAPILRVPGDPTTTPRGQGGELHVE